MELPADCILDEETGNITDCKCLLLPKNFNAKIEMLATHVLRTNNVDV